MIVLISRSPVAKNSSCVQHPRLFRSVQIAHRGSACAKPSQFSWILFSEVILFLNRLAVPNQHAHCSSPLLHTQKRFAWRLPPMKNRQPFFLRPPAVAGVRSDRKEAAPPPAP